MFEGLLGPKANATGSTEAHRMDHWATRGSARFPMSISVDSLLRSLHDSQTQLVDDDIPFLIHIFLF